VPQAINLPQFDHIFRNVASAFWFITLNIKNNFALHLRGQNSNQKPYTRINIRFSRLTEINSEYDTSRSDSSAVQTAIDVYYVRYWFTISPPTSRSFTSYSYRQRRYRTISQPSNIWLLVPTKKQFCKAERVILLHIKLIERTNSVTDIGGKCAIYTFNWNSSVSSSAGSANIRENVSY
jgi:hypothetical protein